MNDKTDTKTTKRWWWPYTHRTVIGFWLLLSVFKIALGASAAVGNASQGTQEGWLWLLNSWNLTYDFAWSELTEGEGSLFWAISVNGYTDADPKNIAKFPLYPAATRALWDLSGRSLSVPFLLSAIHSLMVWAGLAEIFRFWENYHPGYGKRAIMWLCFSPLFIFHVWLASYMEPGFIALVWLTMTLEYQQRWAASSAILFCLTMLQPSGVILACFLGIRRLYMWSKGNVSFAGVLWALGPGLAWTLWMILTTLWFDKLLAPYAFQADWGARFIAGPGIDG